MVSVVIPFYANFVWLIEAIESVLNQTYGNFEIVVVNDGSPEDDTSFLRQYGESIQYYKTDNFGPAAARNFGIEKATGDFIAFLDSDDVWLDDKLEVQVKFMEESNLIWSHTGYSTFDTLSGDIIKEVKVGRFYGDVFLQCLVSSPIATPCVMIRRSFFYDNQDIRFPEFMRYGQDSLMWLLISERAALGVVEQPLSRVRMRGSNAGTRAVVYLYIKSRVWKFLKSSESSFNVKISEIPILIRFAYWLSHFSDKFLTSFRNKVNLSDNNVEIFAKLLYLPSHLALKVFKHFKLRSKY